MIIGNLKGYNIPSKLIIDNVKFRTDETTEREYKLERALKPETALIRSL